MQLYYSDCFFKTFLMYCLQICFNSTEKKFGDKYRAISSLIVYNVASFFFVHLGVLLTAICLMIEMCERSPDMLTHFRKVTCRIIFDFML
jgi:hypothetical protein